VRTPQSLHAVIRLFRQFVDRGDEAIRDIRRLKASPPGPKEKQNRSHKVKRGENAAKYVDGYVHAVIHAFSLLVIKPASNVAA